VRWWRLAIGAGLLIWVLGAAYYQARKRGQRIGLALFLLGLGILCFVTAAFVPRPPVTDTEARALIVASILLLALAMTVLLVRGFVGGPRRPER
jgi:peptidoglycan/LPS O-acetylase OafA/YrhL